MKSFKVGFFLKKFTVVSCVPNTRCLVNKCCCVRLKPFRLWDPVPHARPAGRASRLLLAVESVVTAPPTQKERLSLSLRHRLGPCSKELSVVPHPGTVSNSSVNRCHSGDRVATCDTGNSFVLNTLGIPFPHQPACGRHPSWVMFLNYLLIIYILPCSERPSCYFVELACRSCQ